MVAKWIEALTGPLEQKKQYRAQLARIEALPEPYRAAATAVHRYLLHQGGLTDGDAIGSVMVAGRVISDRVNAASAAQTALKNIVFVGANATVRGYSVTYEKDGGTGDVPVDATMYADGEIVALSKSYPLTKSSKAQIGWALSSGGDAVDTVTIAGADVKVYPVFEA